jgi:riboflavin synthase
MFTGIIQSVGAVTAIDSHDGDARLQFAVGELDMSRVRPGDSIAVNGACLTAVEFDAESFSADVSEETLRLTTLGKLAISAPVNLEPALSLASPLGGHLVTGHVDDVGEIRSCVPESRSTRMEIAVPAALCRYIARKGSVTVDGTSLTVNAVSAEIFTVNIVPHTLERTIMRNYAEGTRVNIEVDLIARYLEQLLNK